MISVLKGQNIQDIAIQYLGDASKAFDIAAANNLSVTDLLEAGRLLVIPDVSKNARVVSYYASRGLSPATESPGIAGGAIGIGFWIIEKDFKVG